MSVQKSSGTKHESYMATRMAYKPGKGSKYQPKGALDRAKENAEKVKERSAKKAKEDAEREQKRASEFQNIVNSAIASADAQYQSYVFAMLKQQAKEADAARAAQSLEVDDVSEELTEEPAGNDANVTMATNSTLKIKSSKEGKYSDLINKYAAQYNLDPNMVASIITIESSWNPNATSSANCKGLMQVNPKYVGGNLYDPETSIREGCKIFRKCLDAYNGDVAHALVAYNRGIAGAKGKPTSSYSNKVIAEYNTRKTTSGGLDIMA